MEVHNLEILQELAKIATARAIECNLSINFCDINVWTNAVIRSGVDYQVFKGDRLLINGTLSQVCTFMDGYFMACGIHGNLSDKFYQMNPGFFKNIKQDE